MESSRNQDGVLGALEVYRDYERMDNIDCFGGPIKSGSFETRCIPEYNFAMPKKSLRSRVYRGLRQRRV